MYKREEHYAKEGKHLLSEYENDTMIGTNELSICGLILTRHDTVGRR